MPLARLQCHVVAFQVFVASTFLFAQVGTALLRSGDGFEERVATGMWDGVDVAEDWDSVPDAWDHPSSLAQVGPSGAKDRNFTVEILGLMDTGTNLLQQVLWYNFPTMNFFAEFPAEAKDTEEKKRRLSQKGLWKHANLWLANKHLRPRIREDFKAENAVMIAMVREPLSWLQSIKKAPYKLQQCTTDEDWLRGHCVHPIPAGHSGVDHDIPHNVTYEHLMDIWNKWSSSYKTAWSKMFSQAIIIRYEDLVMEPMMAIREVARQLNLTMPSNFWVPTEPSKKSGEASGRAEAIEKIRTKLHLWKYTGGELRSACTGLDANIMSQFGYDECKRIVEEAAKLARADGRQP